MHSLNLTQETTQKLVEIITLSLGPSTVYVFNSGINNPFVANSQVNKNSVSTYYCCILVLTRKKTAITASNLANTIAEQSGKTITATVLLHKVTDLATKQPNQLRFFDRVLRYGHRLCLDKSAPPFLLANTIPPQDREGDTAFWLKCVGVAQFNIQAAKESPQLGVELCKIALLNTACVQIALGLIRIKMSYTPNEFGLNYLLQLCTHCVMSLSDCHSHEGGHPFFCHSREGRNKRYKMLCAPTSMLLHWTKLNASEEDFLYLLDATQQFLNLASHTCCHSREGGNPQNNLSLFTNP